MINRGAGPVRLNADDQLIPRLPTLNVTSPQTVAISPRAADMCLAYEKSPFIEGTPIPVS